MKNTLKSSEIRLCFTESFIDDCNDISFAKSNSYDGVRHLDNSARCQVIPFCKHELHSLILKECEDNYSCDMILNTSFNVRGEPLVNSAIDALNTFFGTAIDFCVIGSFLIDKSLNTSITTLPLESWITSLKAD